MGEKGLRGVEAIVKLPPGYKAIPTKTSAGEPSFWAQLDSARPSLYLAWDGEHGVWTPPGYVPDPDDPSRAFNQTTGGNAVWDDDARRWIDAKTGSPVSYEQ